MAKTRRKVTTQAEILTLDLPTMRPKPTPLTAKTPAQRRLLSSLRSNTLTMCAGSAGVGKTYVTLSYAADLLQRKEIERIVLARPMVSADGEDVGALPGDLDMKLAPWVFPMMDILEERLGKSFVQYLLKTDRIRISPLAYMRGSSFKDAFIVITECQNATVSQTKMALTRVGENTKIVLDGDPGQTDLRQANGLEDAVTRLEGVEGVGVVRFSKQDVVRSGFCRTVLERYEE